MGVLATQKEILVGKPEDKRSLGRHRRRWEVNIKLHLKGIRCEIVINIGTKLQVP
jgi:hypothetical protein